MKDHSCGDITKLLSDLFVNIITVNECKNSVSLILQNIFLCVQNKHIHTGLIAIQSNVIIKLQKLTIKLIQALYEFLCVEHKRRYFG